MSLLARFEEVAELLFTGIFKKNQTRLQPVEIAKELVRAMLKNKQVSISQVYVPNVYRVFLHSSDWSPFASFGDAFLIELSKYLYAEGKKSGFTFLSKPSIELHSDDTVKPREMFIEVDFDDSIEILWEDQNEEESNNHEPYEDSMDNQDREDSEVWRERTNIFQGQLPLNWINPGELGRKSREILEIIQGPDFGKTFPLEGSEFHMGRHAQCEIVLKDPEISRRHLRVSRVGDEWVIDDLGSTNGTWVNGQRIAKQGISPGDQVDIGQTRFVLRKEEF
jgi:hypothetical protein